MKFTEKIKEEIDNAKSEEEVKSILENVKDGAEKAGVILDDADLDKVAGGYPRSYYDPTKIKHHKYPWQQ